MAQPKVFVSYHHSTEEDAFAARLIADLRAIGASVWADEGELWSGDFATNIQEGLNDCDWYVLVLTPSAITSPWVSRETTLALQLVSKQKMRAALSVQARLVPPHTLPPLWTKGCTRRVIG
jgi:TIR domain-containing protein